MSRGSCARRCVLHPLGRPACHTRDGLGGTGETGGAGAGTYHRGRPAVDASTESTLLVEAVVDITQVTGDSVVKRREKRVWYTYQLDRAIIPSYK